MKKFARIMSLALVIVSLLAVALPAFAANYDWDGLSWKRLGFTNMQGKTGATATIYLNTPAYTTNVGVQLQHNIVGATSTWHTMNSATIRTNTQNQQISGTRQKTNPYNAAFRVDAPGTYTYATYSVSTY